ncbi:MAG TPA: hypothetical protein DER58_06030 [Firmicutes bacterium]|nr:hypothetical protein [Bacillota bacterium]
MQQLHGREFSIEQEVSLQFTEASWNGFMRILFQIPAEVKKQLPIDPRTSDPRTTLQKTLESDIWAIKEGNNLLLLSRCFVLPCTLVRKDTGSVLRVHSCRQTSDGDAVTAFNEGVLIKASWEILLPEDEFIPTPSAETLYSFFFPEESASESHYYKSERPAQPAAAPAPPPVVQPAAAPMVKPAVSPVAEVVSERPSAPQPKPWVEIVKAAPSSPVVESDPAPAFDEFVASAMPVAPTPVMPSTPAAEQAPVFFKEAAIPAEVGASSVPGFEMNAQSAPQTEELHFDLSVGGDLSNGSAVPEQEQSDSLFSLDVKANSAPFISGNTSAQTANAQPANNILDGWVFPRENEATKNVESVSEKLVSEPSAGSADYNDKGKVKIKYSESYAVEGDVSQDVADRLLKKPGYSVPEVAASSEGRAMNDSMKDVAGNRIKPSSYSAVSMSQKSIDDLFRQFAPNNDSDDPKPADSNLNSNSNSLSQPFARQVPSNPDTMAQFQRSVLPAQPFLPEQPQQQQPPQPRPFNAQPVNRTMPEPSTSQPGLRTPSLGQSQVQPFQTNRMGMAPLPVTSGKTTAPIMAGPAKDEGEPIMSQKQIDDMIAKLKGGQ